jgi:hypothetical protein
MPLANTHEVIKRIMSGLFSAEERRLASAKERILISNKEFYRDKPHDGFMYLGMPYDIQGLPRGPRVRVSLHRKLHDEMDTLLKDQQQVEMDHKIIGQLLGSLLLPCSSLQDIRDALPNCVVDTLDELKALSRTRPVAFTIQDNERLTRQFEKILPRIEFYSTTRLLY